MSAMQKKLEEQRKIIEFLASKYEKDTGRRVELPTTIGQLLGDDSFIDDVAAHHQDDKPKEIFSFAEAVEMMRLPRPEVG